MKEVKGYIAGVEAKAAKAAESKKLQMWAYHKRMVEVLTLAFRGARSRDAVVQRCVDLIRNAERSCPQIEDPRLVADLWCVGVHARAILVVIGEHSYRPSLGWFRKLTGAPEKENDRWRGRVSDYF